MFALSKWVYCQSCQAAKSGALNLQIIDVSSKVGSQSSLEFQKSRRTGKRFPDEVYHT
jgi:hypothetical protein